MDTRSGPTNFKKHFSIILDVFYQCIAIMSKCLFKYCQDSRVGGRVKGNVRVWVRVGFRVGLGLVLGFG